MKQFYVMMLFFMVMAVPYSILRVGADWLRACVFLELVLAMPLVLAWGFRERLDAWYEKYRPREVA